MSEGGRTAAGYGARYGEQLGRLLVRLHEAAEPELPALLCEAELVFRRGLDERRLDEAALEVLAGLGDSEFLLPLVLSWVPPGWTVEVERARSVAGRSAYRIRLAHDCSFRDPVEGEPRELEVASAAELTRPLAVLAIEAQLWELAAQGGARPEGPRPSEAARIREDPSASYWLKAALASALDRDPLDAARDAERLAAALCERAARVVGRG
ncbi:hypothetical protein SAMN06265365_11086 [Tistlia consotensis]|uniref:Uncharacterized protein n=2 Tax=Tistlia TaxID=1321364 RepID=A0A1Y6BT62_9PROT|nr:hypothetical protein SAMN05428998_10970 [Tistlia consotensis USBA 355]SNR66319.1 hypothetical protein SAMN06265365_11086 [Tistlia consotensis]